MSSINNNHWRCITPNENLYYASHKCVGFVCALNKWSINIADCCPAPICTTQQMVSNSALRYSLDQRQSAHNILSMHVQLYTDMHTHTFFILDSVEVYSCLHWPMTDLCEMLPSCFIVTTECNIWYELPPQRHMDCVFWGCHWPNTAFSLPQFICSQEQTTIEFLLLSNFC